MPTQHEGEKEGQESSLSPNDYYARVMAQHRLFHGCCPLPGDAPAALPPSPPPDTEDDDDYATRVMAQHRLFHGCCPPPVPGDAPAALPPSPPPDTEDEGDGVGDMGGEDDADENFGDDNHEYEIGRDFNPDEDDTLGDEVRQVQWLGIVNVVSKNIN